MKLLQRPGLLLLSLAAILITTYGLNFVWEMRFDGQACRRLFPSGLVDIFLIGNLFVGIVLCLNEVVSRPSFPPKIYLILPVVYIVGLLALILIVPHGFAISRNNPLAPQ